ncbi:unnamed protein product [Strongylus vulgaris]|uniref:E3 ubiquitin-protein ligase n=1 Tax=Strongylus vulgaris TaxID=40348 RepID=A0A3P7LDF1_STRVU|nr:unnamed protein product [Strongylus vulgaris]
MTAFSDTHRGSAKFKIWKFWGLDSGVVAWDCYMFFIYEGKIQKRMSHDPMIERVSLHEIVNSVANFNKPTSTSAGQFYLKDSLLPVYNPFFYHYSRSDLSQAEQYQQKTRSKSDRKLQACPPPMPCDFEPFFAPAANILKTPCLIKILKLVLDRTGKRSRFSSDRLLHRVRHSSTVCALAVNDPI